MDYQEVTQPEKEQNVNRYMKLCRLFSETECPTGTPPHKPITVVEEFNIRLTESDLNRLLMENSLMTR